MLVAYWAAKGGSGATVLAAAHGLRSARSTPTLLVDLDGDLPAALGVPAPEAGVAEWTSAGDAVPTDALDRIAVPVAPNLELLGRGRGPIDPARAAVLAALLARSARTVVVDCGSRPGPATGAVARAASRSILVTRACYLALQRLDEVDLAPTDVALVREERRALEVADVEARVGAPVRLSVKLDPGVARAIDAGLLCSRLPWGLRRALASAGLDPA
jgi:Flp pilus assembly CpaE family ATPase